MSAAHASATPAMPGLQALARRWLQAGEPCIDVQVIGHRGSVPRESGTHMLVRRDAVAGTIGGGHLELKAIEAARACLAEGPDRLAELARAPRDLHFPLGPALGQCCGGSVSLRLQPLDAGVLARWPATLPRFFLQLYGAGHVGRAIVALLAGIDCQVQWIDEREEAFPALAAGEVAAPHIERLCVEPVEAEVDQAPPGAYFLVLTHSHDLDMRIADAILRRGDFGWFGLIGSRTKRARFVHRLEDRGIAADALARMACPIGLPGIAGKEPAVIAVSVVAQLLQVSGARISEPTQGESLASSVEPRTAVAA